MVNEHTGDTQFVGQMPEQIIRAIMGDYSACEVESGMYEHTFTPRMLSCEDIDRMIETMVEDAPAHPQYPLIAPATIWRLRRARLYGVNPLPSRKIRKCALRRRQARIDQGKRWLQRRQRNEQATLKHTEVNHAER